MTRMAVAVVNYNTREHLRACLATITSLEPSEVIVVDNASTDGSAEMVRTRYPGVVLYPNRRNLGYGAAANLAMAGCRAEYVLLLNSDTRLQPGALGSLRAYLDQHPEAAVVGPLLANPDGTLQASCYPFPTPLHLFLEESTLGRLIAYLPFFGNRYLRTWSHDQAVAVPWVLGAALALRRTACLAVGGFDESFFLYFEEVDLAYRLHAAGWQVHFAPVTTVVHIGGASTSHYGFTMARQLFHSARLFYQRHYARRQRLLFRLVVMMLMVARLTREHLWLSWERDPGRRGVRIEARQVWRQLFWEAWHP